MTAPPIAVLRVRGLRKSFGKLVVSDGIDLDLAPGERHAIIGPNGAGKTSFVNQLGGQLASDAGSIHLGDIPITGLAPERICRLGLARTFQRNNLFRDMTALENVRLAVLAAHGPHYNFHSLLSNKTSLVDQAMQKLTLVGLAARAHTPVKTLSYGEQRQLEIGVALAGDPKVLLLDEPTSGVAPAETHGMAALIRNLPATISVLLIEHDMDVVFGIADRITVLHHGAVIASGPPVAIATHPVVRDVYLGLRRA